MNAMLTDEDLSRLLGEAAQGYEVPEEGPARVLAERGETTPPTPLLRRRWVPLTAAAAAVVVALVLAGGAGSAPSLRETTANDAVAGLSGGSGGGTTGGSTGGARDLTKAPAQADSSAPGGTAWTSTPWTDSVGGAAGVAPPAAGSSSPADGGDSRVVKTGSIRLAVDDGKVPTTVSRVTAVAQAVRGYVSESTSQELGDSPSATLTLRIPVARFEDALAQVRGLGAEVVSQDTSGKDVTAAYADTEAQLASLRAARARFLTILARANTIGETLTVQQKVDEVQGRIDRLEGQRRVLASQSDLATLTVTVGEEADAEVRSTEQSGFGKAWDDAKDGFTSGVEGLIARSGRALLVLLVLAAALAVLRPTWRLARRRLL